MTKANKRVRQASITRWPLVRFVAYAVAILAVVVVATVVTRILVPAAPSPWHQLVQIKNLLLPIVLLLVYSCLVRLMERRPASEIGLRAGFPGFLAGLPLGATLIAGSVLTLWILGMARISEGTGLQGLGGEILRPLVTATGEELLFRVILLAILQEITGSLVAILISAAAFGLAHLGNPGVTPYAIFALSIDGGVMLALAYILTRNMWLAVGVHASWNFTQAFVFGLQDSGLRDPHSFFQTTLSGPALLTGGAFGLEGSLITLGFGVVASAILFELIARRRRWTAVRFELTTLQPRLDPAT